MKLTELRPCDNCGGKLTGEVGRNIQFYVLQVSMAILNPRAINQVLGMNLYFQNKSLPVAEMFVPEADDAVELLADQKGLGGWAKLFICFDCAIGSKQLNLLAAMENFDRSKEQDQEPV